MSKADQKNVRNLGGRPAIQIDQDLFLNLYNNGLTDQQIADEFGVSRQTIIRHRRAHALPPNRKRGERGSGAVREDKSYYQEVKRVMRIPEVAKAVYKAARKYRSAGGDEATSYVATVIDPAPLPKVNQGLWCSKADNINLTQVKYIVSVEQRAQQAVVAGVPGPAVFELARSIKSGSARLIEKLAMAAVVNAFMVGVHETVARVLKELDPIDLSRRTLSAMKSAWDRIRAACLKWAPVQRERKIAANTGCYGLYSGDSGGGTGKVGRGGGRWNTHNRTAWLGAAGY